jgi:hypothetical protein
MAFIDRPLYLLLAGIGARILVPYGKDNLRQGFRERPDLLGIHHSGDV